MSLLKHYILEGQTPKIIDDLVTWATWFEKNRQIAFTQINKTTSVSTIFLGLDHDWSRQGPPRLFETMIFGGPRDCEQWRCSFYGEAEKQHEMAVKTAQDAATGVAGIAEAAGAKLK